MRTLWLQWIAAALVASVLLLALPDGGLARASQPAATAVPTRVVTATPRQVTATPRHVTTTPRHTDTAQPTHAPTSPPATHTAAPAPTAAPTEPPTAVSGEVEVSPGELPVTGDGTLLAVAGGALPVVVILLLTIPTLRRRQR